LGGHRARPYILQTDTMLAPTFSIASNNSNPTNPLYLPSLLKLPL